MRKFIIHPTHRRFLGLLRERYESGAPVVILKSELDDLFKRLPSIPSQTLRNQFVYREVLRAMNRPLSEIQHCTGFVVFDDKRINTIEAVFAKVERNHMCSTVLNALELSIRRKSLRRNLD